MKPKPQLKDRRSSKKDLEETKLVVRQSTIEGEDDSIEVTQTMEATTADDCTLLMTTEEGDPDLATPDDEEFSFGGVSAAEPAEICALCPSPTLSARFVGQYNNGKQKQDQYLFQDCWTWSLLDLSVSAETFTGKRQGGRGGQKPPSLLDWSQLLPRGKPRRAEVSCLLCQARPSPGHQHCRPPWNEREAKFGTEGGNSQGGGEVS